MFTTDLTVLCYVWCNISLEVPTHRTAAIPHQRAMLCTCFLWQFYCRRSSTSWRQIWASGGIRWPWDTPTLNQVNLRKPARYSCATPCALTPPRRSGKLVGRSVPLPAVQALCSTASVPHRHMCFFQPHWSFKLQSQTPCPVCMTLSAHHASHSICSKWTIELL